MTNEKKPILLPLHPKELSDEEFSTYEAEFEITPLDSKSPYERCADEIVYLLNASKVDAIVFEDLDRFDSMAILRE